LVVVKLVVAILVVFANLSKPGLRAERFAKPEAEDNA